MSEIRHRVGIRAPIDQVYAAVHQSKELPMWWSASAEGEDVEGAQIELEFPGYPNHVWEIVQLDKNKLVRLVLLSGPEPWHGSELRFELLDEGNQVFLTLVHHTGPETPKMAVQYFMTKWPMFLVSLKMYLETGQGLPFPNDIKIQHD